MRRKPFERGGDQCARPGRVGIAGGEGVGERVECPGLNPQSKRAIRRDGRQVRRPKTRSPVRS
jgi:hypothetical protein